MSEPDFDIDTTVGGTQGERAVPEESECDGGGDEEHRVLPSSALTLARELVLA